MPVVFYDDPDFLNYNGSNQGTQNPPVNNLDQNGQAYNSEDYSKNQNTEPPVQNSTYSEESQGYYSTNYYSLYNQSGENSLDSIVQRIKSTANPGRPHTENLGKDTTFIVLNSTALGRSAASQARWNLT